MLELKELIEAVEGIPTEQQRLVFADKQLEEGGALADYGMQHKAVVHLVLRLSGCRRSRR